VTRRPLDATTGPVAVVATLTGIGIASQSFLVGAALIAAVPLAFRMAWWMPGAAALAVLAALPISVAAGRTSSTNVLATLVVLLASLSLVHLVAIERTRA